MNLLIRYTEKNPGTDTIEEHVKVAQKHGAVWFGRMGRHLAEKRISIIKRECSDNTKPVLYLTRLRGPGKGYIVHKATILDIDNADPKERALIPAYYKTNNISPFVTLWLKIADLHEMDDSILEHLVIAKSRNVMTEALRSVVSLFVVELEN